MFFIIHFIVLISYTLQGFFSQNTLFPPYSPAYLLFSSWASFTVVWLTGTGDHSCRLVPSTPGCFRWPLQKEEFSLIFVRFPGWGIPKKTKVSTYWKWKPGLARQTKTWGDPSKVYIHERILTRHEKAWHLWRWSRDRASHGWLGLSHHGPLHRHKQDAQVCSHCPLPGVPVLQGSCGQTISTSTKSFSIQYGTFRYVFRVFLT